MARMGRALRLRPVDSLKHIVETNGSITAAAQSITDVINTNRNPDPGTNPADCNIGSTVGSIYLRVEVVSIIGAGGVDNIYMAVVKNNGGNTTFPVVDQLGISDKRKFVIHQEMMMTGQAGGNPGSANIPRTLFKGVIRIPRAYKRNGVEDKLQVLLQHRTGEATQKSNFCIECIYKEFR